MQSTVRIARRPNAAIVVVVSALLVAISGCGVADPASLDPSAGAAAIAAPTAPPSPTAAPADAARAAAVRTTRAPAARTTASAGPTSRRVQRHDRAVFAGHGAIAFHLPSRRVEHIGWHQSGHDGARRLRPRETAAPDTVLERRGRGTGRRTAADIVVHPRSVVTAPVTGTVIAATPYVLYCVHRDQLVFIAPDERPDWVVKVLHLRGVEVAVGDRVEAGVTRIARRARVLPFASQVDDVTESPPWPHVHVEMIDPSVPDRPTPGPGCP